MYLFMSTAASIIEMFSGALLPVMHFLLFQLLDVSFHVWM